MFFTTVVITSNVIHISQGSNIDIISNVNTYLTGQQGLPLIQITGLNHCLDRLLEGIFLNIFSLFNKNSSDDAAPSSMRELKSFSIKAQK